MRANNINYCNQCPNHCPKTDLQCERGRNYFSRMQTGEAEAEWETERGQRGCKDREGRRGERCNREERRGEHCCGPERPIPYDKNDLYGMLRASGHYLYRHPGKGTGQGRILSILSERENMTQKELQEMLRIQPGSMSEILTKLEEKGMVLRKKDETDKRKCILELTEAGREVAETRKQQEEERMLFGALEEAEQEELKKLLNKLLESWK